MLIGTGIHLLIGGGVGFLLGVCVPDEDKAKVICHVKRRLVEALTGEKRPDLERKKQVPVRYGTSYASYSKQIIFDWDWEELEKSNLYFDHVSEANALLDSMKKIVNEHGEVSVLEALGWRVDYTWDKYGWTSEDLDKAFVEEIKNCDKKNAHIVICHPHLLGE